MADTARCLGHEWIALTDHSPRLTVANGLSADRLLRQLDLVGRDPPGRLLRLAIEAGCVFAIDTDAHAPGQLDWLGNGVTRAEKFGITAERVVNTRSAGDLLDWTERNRT